MPLTFCLQIGSREDFWSWLNDTVIHGLFSTHWYNGAPNEPGFTQDLYSNVFGGARIRQLRVKDRKSFSVLSSDLKLLQLFKCLSTYLILDLKSRAL